MEKNTLPTSAFQFIWTKFRSYRLIDLLHLQTEAILLWLFESLPGLPGFMARNLVYRLLIKRLDGFAWIQPRVTIVHTDRLCIGKMFGANTGSYINAVGGIEIGNHVLLGLNVTISSGRHPIAGDFPPVITRPVEPSKIIIEDDVWIGAGAIIMPGVTVRKGTIVGANSVVTKDTTPYTVYVGTPAKPIRSRI